MSAVTHREFYSALSAVWAYLLIVIGQTIVSDPRWFSVLFFLAACGATVSYAFKAARAKQVRAPDR